MASMLVCPLLSSGSTLDKMCLREKCAWYVQSANACSIYVTAHDALINIKEKQQNMNR